ncbi:protein-glutamate O-methyltransferase CheR [Vibrio sp. Of7-15]|uniref:CheR family methyltransferase n=1 Tax=Vibrio sp. Of7-15 TaxID=2724879 RepID=UPI0023B86F56|nr:protein-glutamate O-methyltransferase CheR [Vibrio sp. Of7-15]
MSGRSSNLSVRAQPAEETTLTQEFSFTEKDFKFVQWFMHKNVGIYLPEVKRRMIYGRLSRRVRELSLTSVCDYLSLVKQQAEEQEIFINLLTTNKTDFFRESHHFDYVVKTLVPKWKNKGQEKIRVWSAGCSTGQEPYSLASVLESAGALMSPFLQAKVLASDLDTNVLKKAQAGIYPMELVPTIPEVYLKAGFVKGKGANHDVFKAKNAIKENIRFKQINLLGEWSFKHKFDLIFCRNVMIYFDKETQEKLLNSFHRVLADDGVLIIGHSENVGSLSNKFEHIGHTIYLKN